MYEELQPRAFSGVKLPRGTQERKAPGEMGRTSTVLCKYICGDGAVPGPTGAHFLTVWQELSLLERLTGPVGKAKQPLISFLALAHLTNEREEQAWRGTEAVATGGLGAENLLFASSGKILCGPSPRSSSLVQVL